MTLRFSTGAVFGLAMLAACGGDDGGKPGGGVDAPGGACGGDTLLTGEVVDWDSNSTAFCGVFQATVTVRATTKVTTNTTNPNGRVEGVCVPKTAALIDVTAAAAASQCASMPGTYPKAGIVIADPAVIAAGGTPSVRLMSSVALARMYTMAGPIGGDYNSGQAQVVFHFTGNPHTITTTSNSFSKPQQFNGTQWEPVAGAAAPGSDVLYPNVDASVPITFSIAGGNPSTVTLQPGTTLVADKFTYVTVVTP
ncbi:MAG TPA: hypothetical protein VFP84_12835 [Kofleriaceae bacterium]|nr:hypothetical protein [Kofleriaceae bacterium]